MERARQGERGQAPRHRRRVRRRRPHRAGRRAVAAGAGAGIVALARRVGRSPHPVFPLSRRRLPPRRAVVRVSADARRRPDDRGADGRRGFQ